MRDISEAAVQASVLMQMFVLRQWALTHFKISESL